MFSGLNSLLNRTSSKTPYGKVSIPFINKEFLFRKIGSIKTPQARARKSKRKNTTDSKIPLILRISVTVRMLREEISFI
jgi:hypothetical protein